MPYALRVETVPASCWSAAPDLRAALHSVAGCDAHAARIDQTAPAPASAPGQPGPLGAVQRHADRPVVWNLRRLRSACRCSTLADRAAAAAPAPPEAEMIAGLGWKAMARRACPRSSKRVAALVTRPAPSALTPPPPRASTGSASPRPRARSRHRAGLASPCAQARDQRCPADSPRPAECRCCARARRRSPGELVQPSGVAGSQRCRHHRRRRHHEDPRLCPASSETRFRLCPFAAVVLLQWPLSQAAGDLNGPCRAAGAPAAAASAVRLSADRGAHARQGRERWPQLLLGHRRQPRLLARRGVWAV